MKILLLFSFQEANPEPLRDQKLFVIFIGINTGFESSEFDDDNQSIINIIEKLSIALIITVGNSGHFVLLGEFIAGYCR